MARSAVLPRSAEPIPVAVPTRVADRLAAAPDGVLRVLHACAEGAHLDLDGRAVAVLAWTAPGLPHAIRTHPGWVTTELGPRPYLEGGILHWGGRTLVTHRLVDVRAPRLDAARVLKASPAADKGTPRPRGAGLVAQPSLTPDSVGDLVGRGDGLTPYGDDVVCGWLALHRALGVATPAVDDAVRRALRRTTTLSATLLECALAGEVADAVGAYLRALSTPAEHAARVTLEVIGHSSGRGLAHGIDLARGDLAERAAA